LFGNIQGFLGFFQIVFLDFQFRLNQGFFKSGNLFFKRLPVLKNVWSYSLLEVGIC